MNKNPKLTMILALVGGLVLANASIGQSFAYTASVEKAINGHFTMIVKDEFGNIKDYIEVDNTITNEGDGCIANLTFAGGLSSCSGSTMDSLGVSDCDGAGTGDTNAACGDGVGTPHGDTTTLFDDSTDATSDDIGDECKASANSYTTGPNTVRMTATFTVAEVDASGEVAEAGVLNGCGAGDQLFAIKSFTPSITITGSDTLTINYDITFSG